MRILIRGGESAGFPAVALLSLREPVSSPRRHRRKPMRTLTIRFAVLIAAFAVISPSALAQEPSGGATAPAAAPAPFRLSGGGGALLGKKVRFRGTVDAKLAGRPVVVQAFDPATAAWTKQAKTTVKDDGTGIRSLRKNKRMGIHMMKYRADVSGGKLEIESRRGRGTTVTCRVPLNREK